MLQRCHQAAKFLQSSYTKIPTMAAGVLLRGAGAAAGGLAACPQGGGDRLVHVGCGDGALTKMLASKGLRVFGVDTDMAERRKGA